MPPGGVDSAHAHTRVAREVPPADVALDLRLSPGENTWRFARAKLVGGSPMAWEQAYIPAALVQEEPAPEADWDQQLFVAILARITGHKARRCRAFLQAVLLGPELAHELHERPSQPALEVVRLWHNELGNPVMLTRSVLKSGGSRYYVDLADVDEPGEEGRKR
jgi:DNA-binding GntR family transcriptional regulator